MLQEHRGGGAVSLGVLEVFLEEVISEWRGPESWICKCLEAHLDNTAWEVGVRVHHDYT